MAKVKMVICLTGIRWIVGIPIGYYIYLGINGLNGLIIQLLFKFIPFVTFWSIEALIVGSFISIYVGMAFAYLILPRDNFALVNNLKIKILYFAISLWSVIQFIILGVSIYYAFNDPYDGVVYHILYPIFALIAMWFTHRALCLLDFKYNQPARDYYEAHMQTNETQETLVDA